MNNFLLEASASLSEDRQEQRQEQRRRRRTHQKKKQRRHRDLTPEEDNRRRHIKLVLLIVPIVLAVAGLVLWGWGAYGPDEVKHNTKAILNGRRMMAIGLSGLFLWLVWTWIPKVKTAIREWRHPPVDTSLHWERRHQRKRKRKIKHRSPQSGAQATPEQG